jgi:hypothetical protein
MPDLLADLTAAPSGRPRPVWFDSLEYCGQKLLGGEPVPWTAPGELTAFASKAQGMFQSDALLVDLADLCAARVTADEALREGMAARTRPGYALRTLLADEETRAIAVDALSAVAAVSDATPVVLSLPSPPRWLVISAEQAGQPAVPPDADRADTAAMYIADFLRIFATLRVDGLLLDEGATATADLLHPDAYRPVFNVTDNYEWPALVSTPVAPAWPHGAVKGVAGWVGSAAAAQPAGPWGVYAADTLWAGADPADDADFVLAVVPAAADPGAVMQRVRALA